MSKKPQLNKITSKKSITRPTILLNFFKKSKKEPISKNYSEMVNNFHEKMKKLK